MEARVTLTGASETVTVLLPDGRMVDVFGTGNVQVYTDNRAHGYELTLHDRFGRSQQPIRVFVLG